MAPPFSYHGRMNLWPEFLTLTGAHALAVASPGPDFAIVLRQSLMRGRRAALWTSVGIGCGLCIHLTYCILGLGLLLKAAPGVVSAIQCLCAAYLAHVGVQALRAKPRAPEASMDGIPDQSFTARGAFATGFLVNVLNPKVGLFFITLFPLAVSPQTPKWIQAGYGLWLVLLTIGWFSLVSLVFTRQDVRGKFLAHGHWIDRVLGAVFLGLAAAMVWRVVGRGSF